VPCLRAESPSADDEIRPSSVTRSHHLLMNMSVLAPKTSIRLSRSLLALLIVEVAMLGCGGGSSESAADPASGTYDVGALWASYAAGGRTDVLVGTGFNFETLIDNDQFEYTFNYALRTSATFPVTGESAFSMARSGSYVARTQVGGTSLLTREDLYTSGNYRPLGRIFVPVSGSEGCELVNDVPALPAAAGVFTSGQILTASIPTSCNAPSSATSPSTSLRWNLTQTEGLTLFCLAESILNAAVATAEYCFEVTSSNTLGGRARVRLPWIGSFVGTPTTLTLRNYTPQ
jgi:hypothetical protein